MAGRRYLGLMLGLLAMLAALAAGSSRGSAQGRLAQEWGETSPRFADIAPDWGVTDWGGRDWGGRDWRDRSTGAMRLGLPADRWAADDSPPAGPRRADRCKRWRAVAESLGETFAG